MCINLPKNILYVGRTENQHELARFANENEDVSLEAEVTYLYTL